MRVLQRPMTALMQLPALLIWREAVDFCSRIIIWVVMKALYTNFAASIAWQTDCCVGVPILLLLSHGSVSLSSVVLWSEGTKRPRVPFLAARCIL